MPRDHFPAHTPETAPAAARPAMEATTRHLGYLPGPVRSMAESPELLTGFLELNKRFEGSTLDPLAREVLVLTIATRNACHVCVAMHTGKLTGMGADETLIDALRAGTPLAEPRLEAVRLFTLELLATAGAASPRHWRPSSPTASARATPWRWCSVSAPTPCPPSPTASRTPSWTSNWPRSPGPRPSRPSRTSETAPAVQDICGPGPPSATAASTVRTCCATWRGTGQL